MKRLLFLAGIIIISTLKAGFCQEYEHVTIHTYFPTPYGDYRILRARQLAVGRGAQIGPAATAVKWGLHRGTLSFDQGGAIELGGWGQPYIDFIGSNPIPVEGYDVRLQLTNDNVLSVLGGNIIGARNCILQSYPSNGGYHWCLNAGYHMAALVYGSSTGSDETSGYYLCCEYR